ncbi:MAG TPA: thioesterase family protein [Opitutaceae bacterium]|nr:thioesterase family protein [Opitutaceae bacterium]
MPFSYQRTVRLADTDAAGVVYFARVLSLCHEAYEEALAAAGLDLNDLLGAGGIVVPIAKSEAEYLRPLRTGDKLRIVVTPDTHSEKTFSLRFEVVKLGAPEKLAARVRTEHVCTSPAKRERAPLPPKLLAWVRTG